jgi:hypothetical protein
MSDQNAEEQRQRYADYRAAVEKERVPLRKVVHDSNADPTDQQHARRALTHWEL